MSTPDPIPDDPLARAEDALRGVPVPEGPSEATVARTLAALLAAAGRPVAPSFRRRRWMIASLKVAAVLVAAAGGLAYLGAPPPGGTMVAFATTVRTFREAQGYSFRMTMNDPDVKQPLKSKTYYRAPGVTRTEQEGGQVVVVNMVQGKALILDEASKSALVLESKPVEKGKLGAGLGLVEEFRKLEEADGVPAGEKEIGGVKARGFRVKKPYDEMLIWVSPDTGLPLLVETTTRVQGKEMLGTLSDFVINPDLDDDLFRTEPPAGYTVRRAESDVFGADPGKFLDVEDAAIRLLRVYAEKSGGKLPPKIDDLKMFDNVLPKEMTKKKSAIPDPELLRVVQTLVRFMMAARELKDGFGYKADGVKFGDASTIIFWYKPKGANLYRAVYADLHAADVAADKLPAKPAP